jgi:hypothetical protein
MTKPDGVKRFKMVTTHALESIDGGWVAASDYDRLAEEVGRLRELLTRARDYVRPTDYESRSDDELRSLYPEVVAVTDDLARRIDQALAKGDCDE